MKPVTDPSERILEAEHQRDWYRRAWQNAVQLAADWEAEEADARARAKAAESALARALSDLNAAARVEGVDASFRKMQGGAYEAEQRQLAMEEHARARIDDLEQKLILVRALRADLLELVEAWRAQGKTYDVGAPARYACWDCAEELRVLAERIPEWPPR